jgi:hypothetical protein
LLPSKEAFTLYTVLKIALPYYYKKYVIISQMVYHTLSRKKYVIIFQGINMVFMEKSILAGVYLSSKDVF